MGHKLTCDRHLGDPRTHFLKKLFERAPIGSPWHASREKRFTANAMDPSLTGATAHETVIHLLTFSQFCELLLCNYINV